MLQSIIPKLPMRYKDITRAYYETGLGFNLMADYGDYLLLQKDNCELHFFLHTTLDPLQNDGQVYIRVASIETLYQAYVQNGVPIHPHGALSEKPWGQKEFSLLDPDHNLLTFGEAQNR